MRIKREEDDYFMTHEQIAQYLGISKQRVGQIIENAFRKIRRNFSY